MATSQTPRRRRRGERSCKAAVLTQRDLSPEERTPGHTIPGRALPARRHSRTTTAATRAAERQPDDLAAPSQDAASQEANRSIMRARLSAMAAPRDSDNAELARLRAVLRDEQLMTRVTAAVDRWPALTDEQLEILAALLQSSRRRRY